MQTSTITGAGPGPSSSSALNPFSNILALAQQSGLRLPQAPAETPAALRAAADYVQQASEWHDVKCRVDTLQAHRSAPAAASVTTQQALCKQLQTANANFRTIVTDQQEIANRVRALKARECIPVERQHQADVAALLRAVFAAAPQLQQLYEDVAWALSTAASEPGAAWEDRLQPLLAAAGACGAYESGLAAQEALLTKLMEAAAAAVGPAAAAGTAGGARMPGSVAATAAAAF
ncbi:hypothetical protein HYH02_007402 [Chlamydomonas schloesseri]|uniref:Uncharacterized protein n=1 Tax=Chlamydomonas schloesseri TaxID=2026947 RepID=A0A836B507_9CHLO|nr:hypothetical protein HYH02_007402 [Chlamydomonas schloesseri]|eukprot:KAG2447474.1 hypothetical protein HYH02_007402 [Chlamydomonas schloesseri]